VGGWNYTARLERKSQFNGGNEVKDSKSLRSRQFPGVLHNLAMWIALGAFVGGMFALPGRTCAQDSNTVLVAENSAIDSGGATADKRPNTAHEGSTGSKMGAAFKLSSLGLGFEVAGELTRHTNVRGGFNAFSYSRGYDNSGIHYAGDLRWMSGEAHFDYFPFRGGLHLSPGLLVYNANRVTATASAPGGSTLTLNGVGYMSDPANPLTGSAKLDFRKVAPTLMLGLGNLVPRSGKHFSVNLEAGVAFEGSPRIGLNLIGSACTPAGLNCSNVATNPTIQSNIQGQQTKISNDLSPFKYYPLISLGFGYRF
jgi:hypothetical protein